MRYAIRHATHYRYTEPVQRVVQLLRLTPRTEPHQRVLSWDIVAPGALYGSVDAYGNQTHLLTVVRPQDSLDLVVKGEIELDPLSLGRIDEAGALPMMAYAWQTPLTRCVDDVAEFCHRVLPQGLRGTADALHLAEAICDAVQYEPGTTDVTTTAEHVLELGHGVCQDHAHLFLACARGLGVPARYVSGYLLTLPGQVASHAWVDVAIPELGWCSLDVTHRMLTTDGHCRLAVGRDYDSACPVRGVRRGGGEEHLDVSVEIHALET